ncbi:hypothetical protein BN000_00077 [Neobacillus massiliamazoniensis]|uniref:Uncharacterized protein n=1 Tax=Neobacillus massiliamazoniensis TaxID=1499688 RepID=A0A0U1NQ73_9BACI|nr:hypothetical protein BN000_00077 [Neobacillus massiliamazoniensis]
MVGGLGDNIVTIIQTSPQAPDFSRGDRAFFTKNS